jgi:hypothetical protein
MDGCRRRRRSLTVDSTMGKRKKTKRSAYWAADQRMKVPNEINCIETIAYIIICVLHTILDPANEIGVDIIMSTPSQRRIPRKSATPFFRG